jgi:hypothetical protein
VAAVAVKVMALRASLDPVDLARKEFRLRIEGGRLYLSEHGLAMLLPPGLPLTLQRITPGVLHFQARAAGFNLALQSRPSVTAEGRLRLPVSGLMGFVVPILIGLMKERLTGKPGLHFTPSNEIELDLAEIIAYVSPVELPPLRAARAGDGVAELEF